MKKAVLGYLAREKSVLLGMKKRGFGKGKLNGFGGKLEGSESPEQALEREAFEEIGVELKSYSWIAELHFFDSGEQAFFVDVFLVNGWIGDPKESDELKPEWFSLNNLPFSLMWEDDLHWLDRALKGEQLKGFFWYKGLFSKNPVLLKHSIETL